MFLGTACSNAAQAQMPSDQNAKPGPNPVGQTQPFVGGMNNFNDTAPGAAVKGSGEKAKALIDNAERNINADEPRNAQLYKNPGRAVERTKETLGNSVKEGTESLKGEAQKLGNRADQRMDYMSGATKDLSKRVQEGAENVKDNLRNAADDAVSGAKRSGQAIEDAGRKANRSIQDAID